jgi:hypothetical protein
MRREAEGCEIPSSLAAREKLLVRDTCTKSLNASRLSFMSCFLIAQGCDSSSAVSLAIAFGDKALYVDEAAPTGDRHRMGAIACLKLGQDALDPGLNGLLRHMQRLADASVLMASSHKSQNA